MLNYLKEESNMTLTENGAAAYTSTTSNCLDLFAAIGAIRSESEKRIIDCFIKAYAEDSNIAMKILFFGRDVRGGLGERRVFRIIVNWLADHEPESLRKNIALIPEYGRFDDLLALMGTACEEDAIQVIKEQLEKDMSAENEISLLAKWLPSVNASNRETVLMAKRIAKRLGMSDAEYRKVLAKLRRKIRIIENNLREKDYSFDYSKQPSKAMFKYRKAFARNDGERYSQFLTQVQSGTAAIHTDTLMPYDVIAPCFEGWNIGAKLSKSERKSMDVTWNSLENFGTNENALAVVDGSGSMYCCGKPTPIAVALSLGIYFAERNTGAFRNHFITFSQNPRLVEIKGKDIAEKVRYCARYNEVANTNLQAVFELILKTAIKNSVPKEDLPKKIYIISDMEFDSCIYNADITNFAYAKKLFEDRGYQLPEIVFWNVCDRNNHRPVTKNQAVVALVSGCTPRLFSMVAGGVASPYNMMMEIIQSERYALISA
ncbi:MAG: DUF2828 family protein [Ruminococcus sp.]